MRAQTLLATQKRLGKLALFITVLIFTLLALAIFSLKEDCEQDHGQQKFNHEQKDSENCETWRHFATRDPAGLFTLWLVFIAAAQAGLFFWQLDLISKSLADGRKAANAARKAAKAAQRQAKQARASFIAEQRAWLKLSINIQSSTIVFQNGRFETSVSLTAENIGRAPALYVSKMMRLLAYDPKFPVWDQLAAHVRDHENAKIHEGHTIFPGGKMPENGEISEQVTLPKREMDDAMACSVDGKSLLIYLGGSVSYYFPSDTESVHHTLFLFQMTPLNPVGLWDARELGPIRVWLQPLVYGQGQDVT